MNLMLTDNSYMRMVTPIITISSNTIEIPITNTITLVDIPIGIDAAWVTFYGWFIGDGVGNYYRVDLVSFDSVDNIVTSSWVSETYIPPMSETVTIALPIEAIRVQCTISGPEPGVNTVWSNAKLTFWH